MSTFSSDGFDLDAVASTDDSGDVVFEIGGGATVVENEKSSKRRDQGKLSVQLEAAEQRKSEGNEYFKQGKYLEAYDLYTEAIDLSPCELRRDRILQQRDEFDEAERERMLTRRRKEEEQRKSDKADSGTSNATTDPEPLKPFVLPSHQFGYELAIYYCNRAAAQLHMGHFDETIKDCDVAVLLNPKYTKAFVRRSTALEKLDRTEEALSDMKIALQLEPSNGTIHKSVSRLQKLEEERLEKLKAETMGTFGGGSNIIAWLSKISFPPVLCQPDKLKDLGNSILGNFGLSLDNFKAVQDPNTGSYNISFGQGS